MGIFRLLILLNVALFVAAQDDLVRVLEISPSGNQPKVDLSDCPALLGGVRADCAERAAYGALPGHGLEPLIRVRFSGAVDPATLRAGVFVVWGQQQGMLSFGTYPVGYVMPINQVAYDPATFTLYAKPDEPLDMARRYTVRVTDGVKDTRGRGIVVPSVVPYVGTEFQTMDPTAWVRGVRLLPGGSARRTLERVFDLQEANRITLRSQTSVRAEAPLSDVDFPADPDLLVQLGLRRAAFFRYPSPSLAGQAQELHFVVWLPATPPPPGGYPVVFAGHGLNDSRLGGPTLFASALVSNSAVIAVSAFGHGFGPGSMLRFGLKVGGVLEVANPGRGVDLNGDGQIGSSEGCVVFAPGQPTFVRDCLRQTAVDYLQLVREIEAGIDVDGDGRPDLSSQNVKYIGQSLGALYGTIFAALEPKLESAVLNVGGGSGIEAARYGAAFYPLLQQYFQATHPALLERDGRLADPQTQRYQPVQILTNPRSGATLEALDRAMALETDAAPASFSPLLKQGTLVGQPIKRVLFQYALGDQTIPNIASGQLIRAGYEYELVSVYRHDRARRIVPTLPEDPHAYLAAFASPDVAGLAIGLSALQEASGFLASGKREVPDANLLLRAVFGVDLFERPSILP